MERFYQPDKISSAQMNPVEKLVNETTAPTHCDGAFQFKGWVPYHVADCLVTMAKNTTGWCYQLKGNPTMDHKENLKAIGKQFNVCINYLIDFDLKIRKHHATDPGNTKVFYYYRGLEDPRNGVWFDTSSRPRDVNF